jgi:hypothetical protein
MRYITKSRIGLALALPSWVLLFLAIGAALGDLGVHATKADYERKDLYFRLFFFSALILFFLSLGLATWGIRRDKWVSVLTYAVHIVVIIALSMGLIL